MPKKRLLGCSFPVAVGIIIGIIALLVVGFISGALGQAITGETSLSESIAIEKPHIQLPAETIFHIGPFGVTNTLLTSWISMLVLVLISWAVTRRLKIIPGRLQSLLESAFEWMLNFCVEVAGEKNGRRFFPLVTTIFLFVLMNAWMNLIPGYGAITKTIEENVLSGTVISEGTATGIVRVITNIDQYTKLQEDEILVIESAGWEYYMISDHPAGVIIDGVDSNGKAAELCAELGIPCITSTHEATIHLHDGQHIRINEPDGTITTIEEIHLLRGANTDINLPLALAIISFIFVLYHGFKALGFPFLKVWFNFGRLFKGHGKLFKGQVKAGFGDIFMGTIDVFVGLLELLSYIFRIVSFTFRLFGNMTGGEILILMMIFLVPWILAIPFYGLELLVGTIQALVFAGLTLVFAAVATTQHESE
ncbi:MAG: F0F1 ATP synthase subunit A [Dehalococcoidales bacterium]|nr:F0F1 ATP synthase subunit A [Dehalococcoidales bacterium]